MKKQIFTLLVAVLTVLNAHSQLNVKPDSLTLKAMEKIYFLTGKWAGSGWIQMRDKHHFIQSETVTQKVNGAVIVIDGLGIEAETRQTIHQAFAVVSYDSANKKYLMRAFRGDGSYIDADASVDDNGSFIWGFTHPMAGQMRYTTKLVDGKWVETGEMSRDGNNWFHFFEMTLAKE